MKKRLFFALLIAVPLLGFKAKDGFRMLGLKFVAPTIYGKANVYNPEPGEIIFDTSDTTFYGYTQANSWTALSGGGSESGVPAGTILPFGGTTAPNGYVFADGRSLDKNEYPALFDAIGCSFGGECSIGGDLFNVPDLRGRFPRGVDGLAGRDPDSTSRTAMTIGGNTGNNVGSVQGHAFQTHTHSIRTIQGSGYGSGAILGTPSSPVVGGPWSAPSMAASAAGGTAQASANETRPTNIYVNYIIKY